MSGICSYSAMRMDSASGGFLWKTTNRGLRLLTRTIIIGKDPSSTLVKTSARSVVDPKSCEYSEPRVGFNCFSAIHNRVPINLFNELIFASNDFAADSLT